MSDKEPNKKSYTTVMSGIRGYYAALIGWFEEDDMCDVINTSDPSFKTFEEAETYAKEWADAEGVEYA